MTTIGGAIRTVIVNASALSDIGQAVYRDVAPDAATMPYVIFLDGIGDNPELYGDGAVLYRQRLVHVELWQSMPDESDTLEKALETALDGAILSTAGDRVVRCRLWDSQRMPDPEYQVVRQVLTLRVVHGA